MIVQIEPPEGRPAGRLGNGVEANATRSANPVTACCRKPRAYSGSRERSLGPMAYAMMGGIIVGTLLTLLFLPALRRMGSGSRKPGATRSRVFTWALTWEQSGRRRRRRVQFMTWIPI